MAGTPRFFALRTSRRAPFIRCLPRCWNCISASRKRSIRSVSSIRIACTRSFDVETRLADFIKDTPEGREADAILRACVHCGFCTATCPTYQLLGDELDGPRGRIYLIKQMLEGDQVSRKTQLHLDRCLTCRSCETTCPSGVRYGRLVDVGRRVLERQVPRHAAERMSRWLLRQGLTRGPWFPMALSLGRWPRPLLPRALAARVPAKTEAKPWPRRRHARRMLSLGGCVQPHLAPGIDAALARALDRVGISLVQASKAGCCEIGRAS